MIPAVESYCWATREGKDMTGVYHGIIVSRPCIQYYGSREGSERIQRADTQDGTGYGRTQGTGEK